MDDHGNRGFSRDYRQLKPRGQVDKNYSLKIYSLESKVRHSSAARLMTFVSYGFYRVTEHALKAEVNLQYRAGEKTVALQSPSEGSLLET